MTAKPKIAVYLSSHGYGHTIRTGAVLERVHALRPVSLTVIGSAPKWLWPASLAGATEAWIQTPADVGVLQTDDVTVDRAATRSALESWAARYEAELERESGRLKSGFDLVLGDVPPLAFDAAAAAGVESVAIANFSWDWIYARMGFEDAATAARNAYRHAGLLIDVAPSAPMTEFGDRVELGLVGRRAPDREKARRLFRIAQEDKVVLLAFRAVGDSMLRVPEPSPGIKYVIQDLPAGRPDLLQLPSATTFLNVLGACDAVVAKPGYGILGDVGLNGIRMLYTDRSGFPEDPVLVGWLRTRPGCARVSPESLADGSWLPDIRALLERPAPAPETDEASQAAASAVLERLT